MKFARSTALVFFALAVACGKPKIESKSQPSGPSLELPDANGTFDPTDASYSGGVTRPCVGLECQQTTCQLGPCKQMPCPGSARTSLRGRIHDPAGKVPLYNVVVYVPNGSLDPIATGPSCQRCESPVSGQPIAAALTDTQGEFLLDNIPAGQDIPLVIQIGKWRRSILVPQIAACSENRADDPGLYRLPRNQQEGHLPRIALVTGGRDILECLLRKIGVDEAEFTPEAGPGRVNFYAARGGSAGFAPPLHGGAAFPPATTFWNTPGAFEEYDLVLLSCEGAPYLSDKSPQARQALQSYADAGGRVFASHFHNVWLERGPPPWPQLATFVQKPDPPDNWLVTIDMSFPKGEALGQWLVNVGASSNLGQLRIRGAKHTVAAVTPGLATRWIYNDEITPNSVQYFTFNTPVGPAPGRKCGRAVFSDLHVASAAGDQPGLPWPRGCLSTELTPQEKALEFMLFDLSGCIQPETERPRPPLIP